jgi:hypothetical protein
MDIIPHPRHKSATLSQRERVRVRENRPLEILPLIFLICTLLHD